jgi:hypothetical protein
MLAAVAPAGEPIAAVAASPRPLGQGSAVVLRPTAAPDRPGGDDAGDLLIHFHGAIDTIRGVMDRAGTTATVIVVNRPGLSAAYAAPFRDDPGLFDRLLAEPLRDAAAPAPRDSPRWRHVTLSCFSAGYGAVREILGDEAAFARVDAIVAADSIYAGLDETAGPRRQVDARDMRRFVAFAEAAVAGRKVFVISHSAQPTPYSNTTETADYLLGRLGLVRTPVPPRAGEEFSLVSRAGRGGFEVQGFTGASGPAHLFHLRDLDRWWRAAAALAKPP